MFAVVSAGVVVSRWEESDGPGRVVGVEDHMEAFRIGWVAGNRRHNDGLVGRRGEDVLQPTSDAGTDGAECRVTAPALEAFGRELLNGLV